MKRVLFLILRRLRYRTYLPFLDRSLRTLLDLGCSDGVFVERARAMGFDATGTDLENDVTTSRRSADIVTCFQVLEHVKDPPAAIRNIAGLPWKQLIISVPNEPWFSLWRAGWEPEHLWAVTPAVLRLYLGEPQWERRFGLGRYYVGVWRR